MSVINQVLLELEKRRASGAERRALPDHVRALPEGIDETAGWRLAVGCAVAIVLLAMVWLAVNRYGLQGPVPNAAPRPAVAEALIEKVALASATGATDARPDTEVGSAQPNGLVPASRLSFELSNVPAPHLIAEPQPEAIKAGGAIPAARVLARAGTERSSGAAADISPAPAVAPPSAPAAAANDAPKPPAAGQAPAQVARTADKPAPAIVAKARIEKQERQPGSRELADQEYRKATILLQQGRLPDAQEGFRAALNLHPAHHGARQAMVALMLQGKTYGEAERALQDGLKLAPEQTGFAMTLARLQVDRGDNAGAIATLHGSAGHAQGSPDYFAFLAALMQRQGRHEEAIEQFSAALRGKPNNGVWWLGLAMSLQAVNRGADAQEAYRRAKAGNLNPELSAFADQRLRQLQ